MCYSFRIYNKINVICKKKQKKTIFTLHKSDACMQTTNNEYHNYNTRNCAHIHVPVGTTEASYRTFGYRGIYIWNHISQKININTSYPCFKNLVKIYIQNNNLDNIRLNY